MPTTIIGLPDGGAGIRFPDHPAHHTKDGHIQVTWSAATMQQMLIAASVSISEDKYVEEPALEDEEE